MAVSLGYVFLNVGGVNHMTSMSTLIKVRDSHLTQLCQKEREKGIGTTAQKPLLIARDGNLFEFILEFLRTIPWDFELPEAPLIIYDRVHAEAKFYGILDLANYIAEKYLKPKGVVPGSLMNSDKKGPSPDFLRSTVEGIDYLYINVGGRLYRLDRAVLSRAPDSMLAAMCDKTRWGDDVGYSKDNPVLIDRNGTIFADILEYLKLGSNYIPPEFDPDFHKVFFREALAYGLFELCETLYTGYLRPYGIWTSPCSFTPEIGQEVIPEYRSWYAQLGLLSRYAALPAAVFKYSRGLPYGDTPFMYRCYDCEGFELDPDDDLVYRFYCDDCWRLWSVDKLLCGDLENFTEASECRGCVQLVDSYLQSANELLAKFEAGSTVVTATIVKVYEGCSSNPTQRYPHVDVKLTIVVNAPSEVDDYGTPWAETYPAHAVPIHCSLWALRPTPPQTWL